VHVGKVNKFGFGSLVENCPRDEGITGVGYVLRADVGIGYDLENAFVIFDQNVACLVVERDDGASHTMENVGEGFADCFG